MTYSVGIGQVSVAGQEDNLDAPFMFCNVKGKIIAKRECMMVTSDRVDNKFCISSNCASSLKACPDCLRLGDIEKMGHITTVCCEKRRNACSLHIGFPGAHRSETERREGIEKHLKALADKEILRLSMQEVDKSRNSYLQKEEEKRLEKARQGILRGRERKEEYLRVKSEEGNKSGTRLIAEVSIEEMAMVAMDVPCDVINELTSETQSVVTEQISETTLMLKETIVEMSKVEIQVESQEEVSKNILPEVEAKPLDYSGQSIMKSEEISPAIESCKGALSEMKVEQKQSVGGSMIKFSCPLRARKKMIGEQRCTTFCKQFANNKKCREVGCKSPWLICVACLGHGEYPRYDKQCYVSGWDERTEQLLCKTHLEIGYQNRREDYKKSSLIPDVKVEKLPPHKEVLQEIIPKVVTFESQVQLRKEKQLLQAELDAIKENAVPGEVLKENARLQGEINELSEKQATSEAMLAEKNACYDDLQINAARLRERAEEVEFLLLISSAENKQLGEKVLQLQNSLLSAEKTLAEQKSFIISLQTQNFQLQRDLGFAENCMWKALGKRDCLHEIILDLESELRAVTTAILNQQKHADLEKEELIGKLKQLELSEKKKAGEKKPLASIGYKKRPESNVNSAEPTVHKEKALIKEVFEEKPKFKPTIWSLWGK